VWSSGGGVWVRALCARVCVRTSVALANVFVVCSAFINHKYRALPHSRPQNTKITLTHNKQTNNNKQQQNTLYPNDKQTKQNKHQQPQPQTTTKKHPYPNDKQTKQNKHQQPQTTNHNKKNTRTHDNKQTKTKQQQQTNQQPQKTTKKRAAPAWAPTS
jgi:type IV secretory pathway VirB10-like protein